MNSYAQSGFQNTSEIHPSFEFSSSATTKLGPENPVFSSSVLSKPRMLKSRKSVNPRSTGSSETQKNNPGFNPFCPVSDSLSGVSSSLESDELGCDTSLSRNKHFNVKVTNKVEKVGNAFIDEIRKLRIESQADSHSLPPELPDDMKKLNLGGSHDANLGFSSGRNVGCSFGTTLASELPNDLKKLNLKDRGEVSCKTFVSDTSSRSGFVFGSSMKNNLNMEDPDKSNGAQKDMNVNKSKQTFDSGNSRSGEPMILDEIERLKIGDHSEGSNDLAEVDSSSSSKKEPQGCGSKAHMEFIQHQSNKDPELHQNSSRVPPVEFRTPDLKTNLFGGSNKKIEFSAKKGSVRDTVSRGRKGKLKERTSAVSFEKSFLPKGNIFQSYSEPSESFSPMDVSPYREIQDDVQSARETSLTSDNQTSSATECMDMNKDNDVKHDDANVLASMSVTETESFKSVSENLDKNEEDEGESDGDVQSCRTQYFSASSSVSSAGSSFTFAASSSAQGQASASTRDPRKKNRIKAGPEIYIPTRTSVLSCATSSLQFSPVPRVSVLPSQVGNNIEDTKREITSPTAASHAAQEACEKWRLRGNQAYSCGDLEKAEDYYTRGLSCISHQGTSRDCLRALVLCYSNRAATRMSLGRMRDALRDCVVAAEIDSNFFRVQLRAANCYLALGEVNDASRYFKKLLQSTVLCVERKLILEASDGIQKAQKVSECMDRSAELLLQRTSTDVETALGVISEALVISPYSEQLLEHKATALFTLRRYEELIQVCEQTLEAAEKNSPSQDTNGQSSSLEASELLQNYSFRIWRYSLIFKSNFYLGKLEEALDLLEKQEQWGSMVNKFGNDNLESLIPQLSTARELIRHKSAGNEAFQAARHTEAVEHYTAALSFNVESRPFAAVCFGNRAAAYQALGQISDAIADCSLAIALDGNYLKAISRRATLFEMIRDYDQAAKDLQMLVSLLTKQGEEKATNQLGASVPVNSLADLRQTQQRLFQMEEQSRKGISLNFYLILGVEPSVTAADLKKAYRKAALRHHPDKAGQSLARSGDDGLWKEIAEEVYKDADRLFKRIGEAYAVLSDATKRTQYIEEEMRNGHKKSSSKMQTEAPFCTAERSGRGSGRQWQDVRQSSGNPYYRGFEPSRSGRYY